MHRRYLTLKDIQTISLDILEKVHTFCMEKGISYSLAYGTLIGAIRHKGFIPWDDDVDIIMPRPDYDRFVASFSCPGLALLSSYDSISFLFFSRVCDIERSTSEQVFPYHNSKFHYGVAIDIFPIDSVEDDISSFQQKYLKVTDLFHQQMLYRKTRVPMHLMRTLKEKAAVLRNKVVYVCRGGAEISSIKNEVLRLSTSVPFGSTSHCADLSFIDLPAEKAYLLTEDLESTIPVDFEGHQFCAIKGYDRVLRSIYGDYMQPPPIEQRHPQHDQSTYFWVTNR